MGGYAHRKASADTTLAAKRADQYSFVQNHLLERHAPINDILSLQTSVPFTSQLSTVSRCFRLPFSNTGQEVEITYPFLFSFLSNPTHLKEWLFRINHKVELNPHGTEFMIWTSLLCPNLSFPAWVIGYCPKSQPSAVSGSLSVCQKCHHLSGLRKLNACISLEGLLGSFPHWRMVYLTYHSKC